MEYDALLARAAAARFVLVGDASHGTEDFYRERAEITRHLIAEAGFTAVAVEADWPDAWRVNRWVRGESDDAGAEEALAGFRRFPSWMWRNGAVAEFVAWLREHNDALAPGTPRTGFYGLDLYCPRASMEAVIAYLGEADAAAAQRARERYACFERFGRNPRVYAYEAGLRGAEPCEREVVAQLVELREQAARHAIGDRGDDARFFAEQNARLVVNAERYYRALFRGAVVTWNERDRHMAETLFELVSHLERTARRPAKVVVWAHNSHLGDARATDAGRVGEVNLGQLVRQRERRETFAIGFTTYAGEVTAASSWGGPAERKRVRPALSGSWEALLHERGADRLVLDPATLAGERLQRAIGAVYEPETELVSHYVHARIAEQFHAVVHIDETQALEPLDVTSEWAAAEPAVSSGV
jgi:erythromycin esterase-like protein